MIKWILHRSTKLLERRYSYDAAYMREITDVSTSAGLRLWALALYSEFRGPEKNLWAGAMLASTLDGDCGPCAQLTVDMALEAGVDGEDIQECLERNGDTATTLGLGFRFATAAIEDTAEADDLRDEIRSRFGDKAVIAASYAASVGRVYPVLKRGLGHGKVCLSLKIGNDAAIDLKQAG